MMLNDEHPTSPLLPQLDSCREQVRRISHELMPPEFNYATIDEVLRYYIYKVDKATADSFRENVLSRGGTENPADLYRRFRGQDPDIKALLERDGITTDEAKIARPRKD